MLEAKMPCDVDTSRKGQFSKLQREISLSQQPGYALRVYLGKSEHTDVQHVIFRVHMTYYTSQRQQRIKAETEICFLC